MWIQVTTITYVDVSLLNFSCLNEGFYSTVSFSDCSTMKVIGTGGINTRTKDGFVETICNVFMFLT